MNAINRVILICERLFNKKYALVVQFYGRITATAW